MISLGEAQGQGSVAPDYLSAVVQAVTDGKDAEQSYFSVLVLCTPVLLDL